MATTGIPALDAHLATVAHLRAWDQVMELIRDFGRIGSPRAAMFHALSSVLDNLDETVEQATRTLENDPTNREALYTLANLDSFAQMCDATPAQQDGWALDKIDQALENANYFEID